MLFIVHYVGKNRYNNNYLYLPTYIYYLGLGNRDLYPAFYLPMYSCTEEQRLPIYVPTINDIYEPI